MPQNLGGHVTMPTPPFEKLSGHVQTVPGNMYGKLEVRSFNSFKLVWLTGPLRTDTHKDTDTHRTKTVSPLFTLFTWRR